MESRRHPRHKIEVEILVYPRNSPVVRGHTVDLSESGISALLVDEIRLDEVVRLEFTLPTGTIDIHALARYHNAFRYGFQFLESVSAQEIIARACRQLDVEESLFGSQSQSLE